LAAVGRDQRQAPLSGIGIFSEIWGIVLMQSVRPDNGDPIPLQRSQQSMGSIMIRFVGLLLVSVVVLALIWSR